MTRLLTLIVPSLFDESPRLSYRGTVYSSRAIARSTGDQPARLTYRGTTYSPGATPRSTTGQRGGLSYRGAAPQAEAKRSTRPSPEERQPKVNDSPFQSKQTKRRS